MNKVERYGWKPDKPDQRDFKFSLVKPVAIPDKVDLRPGMPDVYDQGQLGSCTANAIGAAIQFEQMKQKVTSFVPSRLFIYYNERVIEHSIASDSGAEIRDGIKSTADKGVPPEKLWPYDIAKFKKKPSATSYKEALNHQVLKYQRLSGANDYLSCLASGYPFVYGMSVYDSFESQKVADTGIVPLPAMTEKLIGGHAVLCVGYDKTKGIYYVRNSWGPDWGKKGYFTIPFDYVNNNNLCDDFWKITLVEG